MRLIRGSLFYSVPSSQHQESFTAHLSGLEKHTQELSQADKESPSFPSPSSLVAFSVSLHHCQFLLLHPKETKLERTSQSMEVMLLV